MTVTFVTSEITGKTWYNGVCYIFEFKIDEAQYLGASTSNDFSKAIVIECKVGEALQQLKDLENLIMGA